MKRINIIFIIIITVITFISSPVKPVVGAAPSPSDAPTPTVTANLKDKLKQIEILKEKIATKVAEIRQNEKSAVSGTIKAVGDTSITLTAKSGEKVISYSEDTIFFKMTDGVKSDPIDWKQAKKLKKDDLLAVLGYFDSSHSTFSAKYIYMETALLHLTGKIADADKSNYTITVSSPAGNTLVDIETYTKIYSYAKKGGLTKSGFSRLKDGDLVNIFATPNPKEENRASAAKIISLALTQTPAATLSGVPEKSSTPSAAPTAK